MFDDTGYLVLRLPAHLQWDSYKLDSGRIRIPAQLQWDSYTRLDSGLLGFV